MLETVTNVGILLGRSIKDGDFVTREAMDGFALTLEGIAEDIISCCNHPESGMVRLHKMKAAYLFGMPKWFNFNTT